MVARLKLKGIDGGSHKRWRMWFNSKQRAEPYQVLTYRDYLGESQGIASNGVTGTSSVAVKCVDITRKAKGEGRLLVRN